MFKAMSEALNPRPARYPSVVPMTAYVTDSTRKSTLAPSGDRPTELKTKMSLVLSLTFPRIVVATLRAPITSKAGMSSHPTAWNHRILETL